jgi:outer membrane protein, multidrug efflux system
MSNVWGASATGPRPTDAVPAARTRWTTRAPALLAPLVLSACTTLGPDFTRPTVPWLEGWKGGALQTVVDTPSPSSAGQHDDAWWRQFNDPVLDQLVAEAQRANPGVRTAGLRILEARAQLGIAGSALYPQLQQATGSVVRTGSRESGGNSTGLWAASAGFDLAWELDFWGKFKRGIESANAAYFAGIAQYDDLQVLVAAQAASFYGSIRTTELRLRIVQENAAIQKRSLEITERLFRSGVESELDVQQARTQYLSTLASIPELRSSLRQTHNALSVLLARPPGELPELSSGAEKIPEVALHVIADMPADLLRRRPDVRAAELLLAAQSAQIGVSKAALYPSIALTGSLGLSATSLASAPTRLDWVLGPALVWNVFDHGRLENQVLVQDARFQQLYEQYQDTVLRAARELDDAATNFAYSRAQVDVLRDAAQAARRSLDIATIQYREGLVDFQRVLDSQRALFSQQERLVITQGGVVQYLIAVYKAMGGGWQAGRTRPLLDDATRETMDTRSDWKQLLDAPLPPASTEFLPTPPPAP